MTHWEDQYLALLRTVWEHGNERRDRTGVGTRSLFGPTMPSQFLVPDERTVVLWGGEQLACRPCYDGRDFARCADNICISSIPVARVLEAVESLR